MSREIKETESAMGQVPETAFRRVKRVVVAVIGVTVLAIGVAGIVLPFVPAVVIVPAGLAILATEFVWARRWLKRAKGMFQQKKADPKEGT